MRGRRDTDKNIVALLDNLRRAQDLFRKHVVPVFEDNDRGEPTVHGTALVVELNETVFLVSAAHVFDALREEKRTLYMYSGPGTRRELSGQLTQTGLKGGKTRHEDRQDIGVLKLSGPLPPYREVNCEPLSFGLLRPHALPRQGKHFLALGYPTSKTKVNRQSKTATSTPYANYCHSVSADRYVALALDQRHHIAVTFDKNKVLGNTGQIQRAPDPHGMSGSPLWLLHDGGKNHQTLGNFQVAGILTTYQKGKRILLATDVALAMHIMIDALAD